MANEEKNRKASIAFCPNDTRVWRNRFLRLLPTSIRTIVVIGGARPKSRNRIERLREHDVNKQLMYLFCHKNMTEKCVIRKGTAPKRTARGLGTWACVSVDRPSPQSYSHRDDAANTVFYFVNTTWAVNAIGVKRNSFFLATLRTRPISARVPLSPGPAASVIPWRLSNAVESVRKKFGKRTNGDFGLAEAAVGGRGKNETRALFRKYSPRTFTATVPMLSRLGPEKRLRPDIRSR